MDDLKPISRSPGSFPKTRWSLVAEAAGAQEVPLNTLCRQYWQPVYAWVRLAGHDVESAKDLTQGFFAKLLEKVGCRWRILKKDASAHF